MGLKDRLTAMLAAGTPQTVDASSGGPLTGSSDIERDTPPKDDYHRYRRQYRTNGLVAPSLDLRATETVRPGYRVEADDDSLIEKLEDWASSAAYYAGEGHGRHGGEDLLPLLWAVARDHDLDGTVLAEAVWDNPEGPNTLEGVKQFDPAQTDFITPEGSALLPPPDPDDLPTDDDGNRIGPKERTADGKVPAYVQYPEGWGFDRDEVLLSQDDVFKLTRSPGFGDKRAPGGNAPKSTDFGPNRGVSLVESISDEEARLQARLQDYNASIAAHAYPRLIAEFEDFERGNDIVAWNREKMRSFMGKITREGDEKKYQLDGQWTDPGGSAGAPPGVEVRLEEGSVPDIIDSLHFSVDYILSGLRVPKAMVGFGDDINRDITGDQREVFDQDILQNRRKIERKFLTPILRMKAREIRGKGPFDESVDVSDVRGRLEPEEEENPLKDDEFDPAEFKTLMEGITELLDSSADVHFEDTDALLEFVGDLINMDLSEWAADRDLEDQIQEEMGPLDDEVAPGGSPPPQQPPPEQPPPDQPEAEADD